MSDIFTFERRGIDENGPVIGRFRATGIIPKFREHLQKRGYVLLRIGRIDWAMRSKGLHY